MSIPWQDPFDGGPLVEIAGALRNPRAGNAYPVRDGVPVFLPFGAVYGPNARYQQLYDRIAPAYDFGLRLYARWNGAAEAVRRRAYLEELEIQPGASFLEVSVGTGANWACLPPTLDFYGLDLSAGMLARCLRRARRLGIRFTLCQGLAEHLPYPSSAFDSVLHIGGINFFTDPAAALGEMVRVARPGARLVVVDETEAVARRNENKLLARAFFRNRPRAIAPPVALLPPNVAEVAVHEIWNGELWVLTCRKLHAGAAAS